MKNKQVIFFDNYGVAYYAIVRSNNYSVNIKAYDTSDRRVADLIIDRDHSDFFLEEIECKKEYRNRGIASKLLSLVDYLLGESNGIIYGAFCPFDLTLPKYANKRIAKSFYEKNGYLVLPYESYISNKNEYGNIRKDYFTGTSSKYNNSIIVKEFSGKNNSMFVDRNNILIETKIGKIKKIV